MSVNRLGVARVDINGDGKKDKVELYKDENGRVTTNKIELGTGKGKFGEFVPVDQANSLVIEGRSYKKGEVVGYEAVKTERAAQAKPVKEPSTSGCSPYPTAYSATAAPEVKYVPQKIQHFSAYGSGKFAPDSGQYTMKIKYSAETATGACTDPESRPQLGKTTVTIDPKDIVE